MSDIRTVKVVDSVIGDITPQVTYGVVSGASQNTYQRFPATSSSNSALIWNVQIPSENIILDRAVIVSSWLSLIITIDAAVLGKAFTKGKPVFQYGSTDCLQAFPLASLMTTLTCMINNTSLSCNLQDVLPSILKMNSPHHLSRYNSMTPFLPDQYYGNFSDGTNTSNNVLASLNNASFDGRYLPRGAHPVRITVLSHTGSAGSLASGILAVPAGDTTLIANGNADEKFIIQLDTQVVEPLFLSPFIFGESEFNNQGLTGINNLSLTCNIDGACRRVFSSSTGNITSIVLNPGGSGAFSQPNNAANIGYQAPTTNPSLLFRFLSAQPSDLIQVKNVVPLLDMPRYLTSSASRTPIASGSTVTITSNNLQINQIPDKFIITVRNPLTQSNWNNTSGFLAIQSISVNFNNSSGLLSSASAYDLWRISVRNGSCQSWDEFSGQAFVNTPDGAGKLVPTLGSMLVLSAALDLSLPVFLSNGSLGNYNVQFSITVVNQYGVVVPAEICIICVNSGIFVTSQGVSSAYTSLLSKEMVLATMSEHSLGAFTTTEVSRKIGGNMLNAPLTAMKGMLKHHNRHGGGASGGGESGGRLSKHY
jgi:hypothetical protein